MYYLTFGFEWLQERREKRRKTGEEKESDSDSEDMEALLGRFSTVQQAPRCESLAQESWFLKSRHHNVKLDPKNLKHFWPIWCNSSMLPWQWSVPAIQFPSVVACTCAGLTASWAQCAKNCARCTWPVIVTGKKHENATLWWLGCEFPIPCIWIWDAHDNTWHNNDQRCTKLQRPTVCFCFPHVEIKHVWLFSPLPALYDHGYAMIQWCRFRGWWWFRL